MIIWFNMKHKLLLQSHPLHLQHSSVSSHQVEVCVSSFDSASVKIVIRVNGSGPRSKVREMLGRMKLLPLMV